MAEGKRSNDIPWPVQVRLDCLDIARETSKMRGIRDITTLADTYVEWAMRPLPPKPETAETQTGGEAERPAA